MILVEANIIDDIHNILSIIGGGTGCRCGFVASSVVTV